jgi:hypothetical protein
LRNSNIAGQIKIIFFYYIEYKKNAMEQFKPESNLMEEILPKNFHFDKPLQVAASADAYRLTLNPTSGVSFGSRGRVIFQLPSGSTGMYFSPDTTYLQYSLKSTVAAVIDASGYAPIQEISVYFGSTLVSSVKDVNLFAHMLMDHTCSASDRGTSLSTMGCADAIATITAGGLTPRNGRAIAAGGTVDIAIPLIGIFGPGNCTKAVPLSLLRDDIRIELILNPINAWTVAATHAEGSLTMEQVKLQVEVIRLDSAVEQQLIASVPKGVMSIPATDMLCYNTTVAPSSGSISWQIPCRAKSVQAIYIIMSEVSSSSTSTAKQSSQFSRAGLTSYSFRVGGLRVPSIPVSSAVEMRSELYKSLRVLNASNNPSSITQTQYENEAFAIGLNLDAFSHADGGILLDGKSLASSSGVLFEATISSTNASLNVYAYVVCDSIIMVQDGLIEFTN